MSSGVARYRDGVPIEEVAIRSAASAGDFLALRAEPWNENANDHYEGPDVRVELSCGGLHAESVLPAYIADAERLALFFHEIDREWRGWAGEKSAETSDGDWFSVSAVHDGLGHVLMTVHLAQGWPLVAAWSVRATVAIDVGSAASIADALDRWMAVVWPPRWQDPA